ncbi:MAG: hypothetical protein ACKOQ4_03465 [Mycobacterium sp.]
MAVLITGCAGFLFAVLWIDLMFDTQIRRRSRAPEDTALASITGYYRRATTESQPMGALIAAAMVVLIAALAVEAARGGDPGWLVGVSAVLAGGPILLALSRTVPNAVRLGRGTGSQAERTRLARAVLRDHVLCAVGMAVFLAIRVLRSLN